MKIVNTMRFLIFAFTSILFLSSAHAQEIEKAPDLLVSLNIEDVRYWKMDVVNTPIKPPKYPSDLLRAQVSGCVAIGFFIEPDGTTTGHRILDSKVEANRNSRASRTRMQEHSVMQFAKMGLESLRTVRYLPGPENPERIRGFAYTYFAYTAEDAPKLDCQIPDLVAFIKEKGKAQAQAAK